MWGAIGRQRVVEAGLLSYRSAQFGLGPRSLILGQ